MDAYMLDKVSDKEIVREYNKRFTLLQGEKISSAETAARHLRVVLSEESSREYFAVIFLNGANKLITTEILFKGTLTTSQVHPREIVKRAIDLNAAAIICGHNHPSGNRHPSRDDIQITKKIQDACKVMDIALHDHLIIPSGSEKYYSFSDSGII